MIRKQRKVNKKGVYNRNTIHGIIYVGLTPEVRGGGGRWGEVAVGGGVMNGILFLFADPRVFSNVWEFITGSVVKLINEVFCGRLSG